MVVVPNRVNRLRRAPLHLGITDVQRDRFRQFLLKRLVSHLRSGRLTRALVERYRTDLRSSNLPGWIVSDVRCVLDEMTQVVEQPSYVEEVSLAGDFGDLAGILDWAREGIESVWGGVKEGAREAAVGIWQPVSERIFGPEAVPPSLPEVGPEWDPGVPTATQPSAPYVPSPRTGVEAAIGGAPVWVWLLGAGAVLWFLKK
jgi:hypothetical protein